MSILRGTTAGPIARRLPLLGALLAAAAAAAPAGAQPTVSVDLSAYSAMVWRGVTSTNRPVLNPALTFTVPSRLAEWSVGAWSNAEPIHYGTATTLSSYGGAPGPLFSMHELWAQAARPVGGATASIGASAYLYPRAGDLAATYNTVELHATIALPGTLAPTIAAHYDVGRVGGGYIELSGSRDVQGLSGHAITLTASGGWSVGQGARSETDVSYFARDGFTHAEASVATELTLGRVTLTPSAHLAYAADPWARSVAPDRERRWKGWLGTSLSWSRALGRVTTTAATASVPPTVVPTDKRREAADSAVVAKTAGTAPR